MQSAISKCCAAASFSVTVGILYRRIYSKPTGVELRVRLSVGSKVKFNGRAFFKSWHVPHLTLPMLLICYACSVPPANAAAPASFSVTFESGPVGVELAQALRSQPCSVIVKTVRAGSKVCLLVSVPA